MRLFQWRARGVGGRSYQGEFLADNELEVANFVKTHYGYVVGIKEAEPVFSISWPCLANKNITDQERAKFFRQLFVLLKSGIPLMRALGLLNTKLGFRMNEVCKLLSRELRKGNSLARSMERQSKAFSPMSIALVAAGEAGGNLSQVLEALARYYKQQEELRRFIKNACMYPAFLTCFSLLTFCFFVLKIFPMFVDLYASFAAEETSFLRLVGFLRVWPQEHFIALSVIGLIVFETLVWYRGKLLDWVYKIPPVRKMRHTFFEIRFSKVLALMLYSGISLPQAIEAAAATISDRAFVQRTRVFAKGVVRGMTVAEAAAAAGRLFSDTGIEFINVGESSGSLPEMLEEAAALQEQELLAKLRDAKALLEPVLIVIIAFLVLIMVAAILGPMFSLIANLPEYN